ncbi:cytochrome c maturation protein CcmE [Ottowia testudinis]|uniref:Cytochrome c-type biogenesis protein CcmE n=1 Tax=Ottowia testudinis TaxID=2816950 RepID=A0A975H459_9BURK|nr:cytochrome c maturation protein CcmE [Ottowia testudinis]QTD45976.1 cytochrome c maturation protein CcmE [Ottowia testudinis]
MNTATASIRWTPRRKRLLFIAAALLLAGVAVALTLRAFNDNLVFFLTPTQVAQGQAQGKDGVRIGGLVQAGSIQRSAGGDLEVRFALTDMAHTVPVVYRGVLPDLFVEGKGAVAQGRLGADGQLIASEVLAKHDENYVAPGVEIRKP